MANGIYSIHTSMVLGQSQRFPLGLQYRYRQFSPRLCNLTTNKVGAATANREFAQMANEIYIIHTSMVLGQSQRFPLETKYRYRCCLCRVLDLTLSAQLTTTANREFAQNKTPLANEIYSIHTSMVLGQSQRFPLGLQYRY